MASYESTRASTEGTDSMNELRESDDDAESGRPADAAPR